MGKTRTLILKAYSDTATSDKITSFSLSLQEVCGNITRFVSYDRSCF